MKTQEITFATAKTGDDAFIIEKAGNGKAVVIYNAGRGFGGLPAGCGLMSKLAEISLTVAGMTVLGESMIKEMEIEVIGDTGWGRLEAVARIMDSEEDFTTVRCEIRGDKKGRSKSLVAKAYGTICRVKRPVLKTDAAQVVHLSSSGGRAAG